MKIIFTKHALWRMQERSISKTMIHGALQNPTAVSYDGQGKIFVKRAYVRHGAKRLLFLICEPLDAAVKVITIIDTTKVAKYL